MEDFEQRKRDHIQLALDPSSQATDQSGLDRWVMRHEALPELSFSELSLAASGPFGLQPTPFFISGMTAGHPDAPKINAVLAEAAAARGWILGIGSQRRDLKGNSQTAVGEGVEFWKQIRKKHPHLVILGNLGIAQAIHASTSEVRRLVETIGAQGMCIHLNGLQEVMQEGGTPDFRGGLQAIRRLTQELGVPMIVKETGSGMSPETAVRLVGAGVKIIDVSGLGGTHWGRIDGRRAAALGVRRLASETFSHWGISTAESIFTINNKALPGCTLWASGGVRSGLDAAKLLGLGANAVGYAQPALKAALDGLEALHRWMEQQEFELKTALFCTGSETPKELAGKVRRSEEWSR
jgi:isopentenyl-diphosphate delta-isomerase